MNNNIVSQKMINLLGMAQKANQLISGEFAIEKKIPEGRIRLLLVATDASEASKRQYEKMAQTHEVPFAYALSKEDLGQCTGKSYRAAVAVLDPGFSTALRKLLMPNS